MKIAAIVLFILQAVGIFGTIVGGGFHFDSIFEVLGYFLPTIIGVILLILHNKKAKK